MGCETNFWLVGLSYYEEAEQAVVVLCVRENTCDKRKMVKVHAFFFFFPAINFWSGLKRIV